MRRGPHPITGAIYEELEGGRVRVDYAKIGKQGIFTWDGRWLEGALTYADPHYLSYIGGPTVPEGMDRYWGMTPPYEEEGAAVAQVTGGAFRSGEGSAPAFEPVVAMYQPDPGRQTPAGMRSAGFTDLDVFLRSERKPERLPASFKVESPYLGGPRKIRTNRYLEQRFADREIERIWRKTWQMVCREDDIPNPGDFHLYEVAHLSWLVVRQADGSVKAHENVCLHRGRTLRECSGKEATEFRCPYHGWSWRIDGSIKEITSEWDFPGVREQVSRLPGAKVALWAGFVFINPDEQAGSLEDYLGPVMLEHFGAFDYAGKYKQAHVRRKVKANWKVVAEAFKESYHVIATHPQMMLAGADTGHGRYDSFGHFFRAAHAQVNSVSAHRGIFRSDEEAMAEYRMTADMNREFLRGILGDEVDELSDMELNDSTFNDLFPNCHPWGAWARIVFRFFPGATTDESIMDVMLIAPWPKGKPKPPPAQMKELTSDQPWAAAPELGSLAGIIDQDCGNFPRVQAGLKAKGDGFVWTSSYQESMIRAFHDHYDRYMGLDHNGEFVD
jgi:phenylpropionate dioxygenase-like ring-hydroxylating dioxygenase large terminal subunit